MPLRLNRRKPTRTFVVRKHAKDHGLGKRLEGAVKPNDRVLVIDDVLTSGGSRPASSYRPLKTRNLHASHVLVIVDRQEQEGKQKIEAQGVSLISLLTLDDLKAAQPRHLSLTPGQ